MPPHTLMSIDVVRRRVGATAIATVIAAALTAIVFTCWTPLSARQSAPAPTPAPASTPAPTAAASSGPSVLFIGNSYTYVNNLPQVVKALVDASRKDGRGGAMHIRMVAPGGWRLKDHWERGDARQALNERRWDYVVLQDQSTLGVNVFLDGVPRITSDEVFRPYAEQWATAVRERGATPIFYLTWARKAAPQDQAALTWFYVDAAKATHAKVSPVGLAWQAVREQDPAIALFTPDGSHPAPAGTYLAACTFVAALFDRDPTGLPATVRGPQIDMANEKVDPAKTGVLVDLPPAQARVLQRAAWTAWQTVKANGGYPAATRVAPPTAAALPAGSVLSPEALEGTWKGTLRFYPMGSTEMTLTLRRQGAAWTGRLSIAAPASAGPGAAGKGAAPLDAGLEELADLKVNEREIAFSHPWSTEAKNIIVDYRGVLTAPDQLQGRQLQGAVVRRPQSDAARIAGSWTLTRTRDAASR